MKYTLPPLSMTTTNPAQYLKKGKPVVIPGFGVRIEVYLPQSQMKGVLNQPEDVLDMEQAFAEVDQVRWSLGHDKYVVDAWQGLVVKYDLNRAIEIIANNMKDELHEVFDEQFGTDTENWKRIDLTKTVKMIVAQAASRFTVGLPLCKPTITSIVLGHCLFVRSE